ncbi:MAG TPA: Dynamin family protein, partial [Candidatus Fraserbacteria bacterium]|nr:Dynamin family protein [Candidatus Fraserbacteria bacterium]
MDHSQRDTMAQAVLSRQERKADAGLKSLLEQSLIILNQLGPEFTTDGENLLALQSRLLADRFQLAVLGQFKRGKSTLLNALLGEELLPTSVLPLTAIPTFLQWGPRLRARVVYQDGRSAEEFCGEVPAELAAFLAKFVTEEVNPRNRLGISQVEVFHPAPLLKGVVLIDTPGIGSTLRHNTETTLSFLPQCDAALFVVSADPPITEVEVKFLQAILPQVARLFVVLNKIDYLRETERKTALNFLAQVLNQEVGLKGEIPIFSVSARQGLEARNSGDSQRWSQSGVEALERYLLDFLAYDRSRALKQALAQKVADILADVLMRLEISIHSLQLPLTELEERLQLFQQQLQEAEAQRIIAADLLQGDQRRLAARLEEQAESLRRGARDHLGEIAKRELARQGDQLDEGAVERVLAEAIPAFFAGQLEALSGEFAQQVAETLRPHEQRADELVEAIRRGAAELFEVPYRAPQSVRAFEVRRRPYWVTQRPDAPLTSISAGLAERLLPAHLHRVRAAKRLMAQVESLVLQNVENLRWATRQNLDQAFRRFAASLEERLQETIA